MPRQSFRGHFQVWSKTCSRYAKAFESTTDVTDDSDTGEISFERCFFICLTIRFIRVIRGQKIPLKAFDSTTDITDDSDIGEISFERCFFICLNHPFYPCNPWLKNKAVPGKARLASLRRHYPHQVQGVVHLSDLSAIRLPRNLAYAKVEIRK